MLVGFGDSSLNFEELRAIVRDVDQRLRVISDINFNIDAGFVSGVSRFLCRSAI